MDWKNNKFEFQGFEQHLSRLLEKKASLDALRPLPSAALRNLQKSLSIEWAYNSNSIEGNTLTLQETRLVIEEGMTIKGRSLREHFEALNHQEAVTYVESLLDRGHPLAATDILQVHGLVLQKIEQDFAGRYRNSGVRIAGANFVPPNALKVDLLMDQLVAWVNYEDGALHPIVKATIFHHRFVWIHPFFDGNGRTVRLVFNLLLMKLGYPPAIILKNDRKKYYDALNRANVGDYSKLLLLIMQAVERSLDIYLSSFANNYEDFKPIAQIAEDAELNYSQEYLSLLARQGKIAAIKEGKNWLTTKAAVVDYIATRKRKR